MALGPVDFIVVRFPGNQFSSDIAEGISSLTDAGTIRIIDLLFLAKDASGTSKVVELTDLDDNAYKAWDPIVSDISGLMTDEDALMVADTLEPDSSAVLVLVENTWAVSMVKTIAKAKGDVLISERIPRAVVEELVALHQD